MRRGGCESQDVVGARTRLFCRDLGLDVRAESLTDHVHGHTWMERLKLSRGPLHPCRGGIGEGDQGDCDRRARAGRRTAWSRGGCRGRSADGCGRSRNRGVVVDAYCRDDYNDDDSYGSCSVDCISLFQNHLYVAAESVSQHINAFSTVLSYSRRIYRGACLQYVTTVRAVS